MPLSIHHAMNQTNLYLKTLTVALSIFLVACSSHKTRPQLTECDFSGYQDALEQVRQYINGSKSSATISNDTTVNISSMKLNNKLVHTYLSNSKYLRGETTYLKPKPLSELELEYKQIESNLRIIQAEAQKIIEQINTGSCKAGQYMSESSFYMAELSKGSQKLLDSFPYYEEQFIEKNARLKSIAAKKQQEEAAHARSLALAKEREKAYRAYKGTTKKVGNLLFQIEDFSDNKLFFSVKNVSPSEIAKLSPTRCHEYANEQGGVSCLSKSNASLRDNHGNSYQVSFSRSAASLSELKSKEYGYVPPLIDLYPNDKIYFVISSQRVIENSKLTLYFSPTFTMFKGAVSFSFPSNL